MLFSANIAAIEILENEVRVAVAKAGGKLPVIQQLLRAPIECESPEQLFDARVAALNAALDQMTVAPASYVLCLHSENCIARTLSIPFKGKRRVASAVKFELEPYLAFPIEELVVDFNIVAVIDGETEVLAMGIRRDHIEEQLRILEAAGVSTELVTLDAAALTAFWQSTQRKAKGLQAVLHVRERNSCLVILYNNNIAFFRHISYGLEAITQHPAHIAREVQNTLRAFLAKWRGGGEIAALGVTGVPFTFEQREAFAAAVKLGIEDTVLVSQCKGGAAAVADGASGASGNVWDVCAGAAHIAAGAPYSFNFLEEEGNDATGMARSLVAHLLCSSCLALIGLFGWTYYYYQGAAQNRQEIANIEAESQNLETQTTEFQAKGLPADVDAKLFNDPTLLDVLQEISQKMPDSKVKMTQVKVNPPEAKGYWIQLEGTADEAGIFNDAFAQLKTSALFDVNPEPDLSSSGSKVTFKVKIFRKGEAEGESQT